MIITSSGGNYEQPEAGTYNALCIGLIDLGTQEGSYKGAPTFARKVLLQFELDEKTKAGVNFTISNFYTASTSSKAILRKDLESWRGTPFTEDEIKGFDLTTILAKPCMITVGMSEKGKAIVSAVGKQMKGLPTIKTDHGYTSFSLDNYEEAVFNMIPEGLQNIIKKSPEWQKLNGGAVAPAPITQAATTPLGGRASIKDYAPPNQEPPMNELVDDSIPFAWAAALVAPVLSLMALSSALVA